MSAKIFKKNLRDLQHIRCSICLYGENTKNENKSY